MDVKISCLLIIKLLRVEYKGNNEIQATLSLKNSYFDPLTNGEVRLLYLKKEYLFKKEGWIF